MQTSKINLPATIMIVDDEPANLDVLQGALTATGCALAVFPSGEMALERAGEVLPDLVLLDIRMPGVDGYEVCRRFKASPELRDIPILFLSALNGPEEISKGFEVGCVDYILKPFRENEVLARVQTHLELAQTRRQLAESYENLARQEELRDRLVHMLVHDMRSPLQMMIGHLEMLELDIDETDKQKHADINTALAGTRILQRMMADLLDVSRMDAQQMPVHPQSVRVDLIINNAISDYVPPGSRERVVLEPNSAVAPVAWCDPGLTERVVANLVGNALKYAPEDTRVKISVNKESDTVQISVADQGPGIAPEDQSRIFEVFGTVTQKDKRRVPSIGIGLAFCKMAMTAQGGAIKLESEPEQGSVFIIEIPVGQAD